jgi:signal transduction histidine kinase
MSHELRTPLNAIVGYIDLLEAGVHGLLTNPQLETLQRVRRSSKLLLGLINDVLNIARIEAGQVIYRVTAFPVAAILRDMETLMGPQYRNAGLDLSLGPAPDVQIMGDYDKTQQIMLNLLGNSLKFTPRGGRVTVDTAVTDGKIKIVVADTGRGIPAEKMVEIFEPFVQVDRTTTPESLQGVGLGLAISRDLARGMGGDITASSVVGAGATFVVTLPLADPDKTAGDA